MDNNNGTNQPRTQETFQTAPLFGPNPMAQPTQQAQKPQTLEELLLEKCEKWTDEIQQLNDLMKTLPKVDELLTVIYTKRQECVDYYSRMNMTILSQNAAYKKAYNDMFNNVKMNGFNGMRMATDAAISRLVEAELGQQKFNVDMLVNHNNFIKQTIETIDNMIYGVNQKVKIAEMLHGVKY